ncbi:hypothetical protein [Macrococcus brunensis]|uniref:hypothetical protein n=1 Tax=Macrococcus brunensis TaxID=198483 RepID=UPI001EEFEEB7|nr:hypothetical protein [Macrococcus brunensis]ULG74224.1 hypothetical protein MGG13_00170 [Macrococcus brunensis]
MNKITMSLFLFLALLIVAILGFMTFNKYQETQLEKEKIKIEMAKLEEDKNNNTVELKTEEVKENVKDSATEEKKAEVKTEEKSTFQETIKESVLGTDGSWMGDSSQLGFDVHQPSSSRTEILQVPGATYYVMPEEYNQAKNLVYTLNNLDENGKEDCENVNSKCYNEKQEEQTAENNNNDFSEEQAIDYTKKGVDQSSPDNDSSLMNYSAQYAGYDEDLDAQCYDVYGNNTSGSGGANFYTCSNGFVRIMSPMGEVDDELYVQ